MAMGRSFLTRSSTLSPTSRSILGPGTMPLKVHASTTSPAETSQSACSIVRSNTLVPSALTSVGSSGALPTPSVAAGYAAMVASMSSVILS